ncbi:MAG TPA: ABC transporter permease [Lacunisphaera sp.]|nr:ABC transporter permease [Lacunisphaera sp.]
MIQDLRHAFTSLLKRPGFTGVAVLTLALGLAANITLFSAIDAILLRPLPFPDSDRLVSVRAMVKRDTWERRAFSLADFRDYRAQLAGFAGFASFTSDGGYNLTGDGEAARVDGQLVSHDYFSVLGAKPVLGRTFTPEEDGAPGQPPVVVLGHDLWQSRYAASPEIIGQQIRLNDVPHTVVGVMAPGFRGVNADAQLWVPSSTATPARWNGRGNRGQEVVALLKPGVTIDQARAELAAVGRQLAEAYPATNSGYSADLAPLREEIFGALRQPLLVLLGAVGFVLVITCVNVANLLLVRLAGRRREIAIRTSLGASRRDLARLFLGESAVIALAGGVLGVLLAAWGIGGLARWAPIDLPAYVTLKLNGPAMLFALLATTGCALAIGALPALLAGRADLNATLKDAGRTGGAGVGGTRARAMLVTAEIALSLSLLVASALFVRSFANLVTQAPGFSTENVLTLRTILPDARYRDAALPQFARTLVERAAALPGVQSAAIGSDSPLGGNSVAMFASIEGGSAVPAENEARVYAHFVTGGFFRATGITLLQGTTFADSYAPDSEQVVVISENFARRFWPNGDAIGQRLKAGRSGAGGPWFRIIGVVAEAKYRGLVANPTRDPDVYAAFPQLPRNSFTLVVRTADESGALATELRRLVASLDPNVPVFGLTTIEERVSRASASQRFSAQLMGGFALVALLLAALGLYGVVSFGVGERTQEIGVRMALGARPGDIAQIVLGGAGRLVAAGLFAGTALALVLVRFIESLLYRVDARDPLTYGAVAAVLALVTLVAAWLPARRAARVNPVEALRAE